MAEPNVPGSPGRSGRELLMGVMAVRLGLVRPEALDAGRDGSDSPLDPAAHDLLVRLADEHLRRHGRSLRRSLSSLAAFEPEQGGKAATRTLETPDRDAEVWETDLDPDADETRLLAVKVATAPVGAEFDPTLRAHGSRYRIDRPLARGGLGEVFVAEDTELHRPVAVKQIQEKYADREDCRSRFLVEAEVTARLEHPGIVPVHGQGRYADGRPFYAMRLIEGETLTTAIARFMDEAEDQESRARREMELRRLLRRFLSVCETIDYAHSRGILHRDLKPENVMLGPHGETLVVDWGLAKTFDGESAGQGKSSSIDEQIPLASLNGRTPTAEGSAPGTPAYMSPEQAEGRPEASGPSVDVYGLGATLYHMLTGRPPVVDSDLGLILARVRAGAIPPPRSLRPEIDPTLEAICLKAMAYRIEDRYASARALADDLELWLAGEPVSAYRDGWPRKFGRWARRHRTWTVGIAATLGVVLVALLALTVIQARTNRLVLAANTRSEDRLALALEFIEEFHSGVAQNVILREELPELRSRLLENPRLFYRRLIAGLDRDADAESRAILARSSANLAGLHAELGISAEAERLYREARSIVAETLDRRPDDSRFRQFQAEIDHDLGLLDLQAGRYAAAQERLERTITHWRTEAAARPTSETLNRLASALLQRSEIDQQLGKSDNERKGRLEAIDQLEAARLVDPQNSELVHSLGYAFYELAKTEHNLGRRREALDAGTRALDLLRQARAARPEDVERTLDLADAYRQQAQCLRLGDRFDEAAQVLAEGLTYRREALRHAPMMFRSRSGLSEDLYTLGLISTDRGHADEAVKTLAEAVALANDLAGSGRAMKTYLLHRAEIESGYASALWKARRFLDADVAFQTALDHLRPLARENPENVEVRHELGGLLHRRGHLLFTRSRYSQALPLLREAIEHQTVAHRRASQVEVYRRFLANHLEAVAICEVRLGHPAEAAQAARSRRDLTPDDPEAQFRTASLLASCARVSKSDDPHRRTLADEAVAVLRTAQSLGFRDVKALDKEDDLLALSDRDDFREVVGKIREAEAAISVQPNRESASGKSAAITKS